MYSDIKINSNDYYNNYYGHTKKHLSITYEKLRKNNDSIIFLSGDSSLDNKYWLKDKDKYKSINGYENILYPPYMKPDISYHINDFLYNKYINIACINSAIEASTLEMRSEKLLDQDIFIKNNITSKDILIVSVGGNDIVLSPNAMTLINIASLMYMNTIETIKKGPSFAWGLKYFINMFKDRVEDYINKLIIINKPKKIIVCTIYYPDLKQIGGWADKPLTYMGYNTNPEKLQEIINQIFIHATSKIKIDGVEVIPFPMFKILDGYDTNDYVSRVEPSNQGGKKLAEALVNLI